MTNLSSPNDNDFDFTQDAKGKDVCPADAHIRKVNPGGPLPEDQLRHRLLRRGIPFGPVSNSTPQEPGVDDEEKRGLLFLAYMTSIVDQFEFVMRSWVNRADFHRADAGTDALLDRRKRWDRPDRRRLLLRPVEVGVAGRCFRPEEAEAAAEAAR